jgi:hypothetical protein
LRNDGKKTYTPQQCCYAGCAEWEADANGHSCGSRITWVKKNTDDNTDAKAAARVANEYPAQCGLCGGCVPGGAVWNTAAGAHTCGERIEWVKNNKGKSLKEAKNIIAVEFPQVCGDCSSSGEGGTGSPGSSGGSHCGSESGIRGTPPKVGVGFNLAFQKHKLNLDVAVKRLVAMGVRSVRLWSYNKDYLQSLHDHGIQDVLVNVPTFELRALATGGSASQSKAAAVARIIKPFVAKGMVIRVGVGNEPLAHWKAHHRYGTLLPQALRNMLAALRANGLNSVTVTVPFYAGVVGTSYPPEAGAFKQEHLRTIRQVAAIIHQSGGEFTIHIYPWFARKDNPRDVPLDLAIGKQRGNNVINGKKIQ